MKNTIALLIIMFVFVSTAISQNNISYRDTIHVTANKTFFIPEMGGLVFDNVFSWQSYTAEVLDTTLNKIKDCDTIYRYRTDEELKEYTQKRGRGLFDWLVAETSVEEKGTYLVRFSVDLRGENNYKFQKDYIYTIIADFPTMASPIYLDENDALSYRDKETFTFATIEFDDYSKYSYRILVNDSEVKQGDGAVIALDEILSDNNNVGKKVTVEGLYKGKIFSYYTAGTSDLSKSQWEFTINPPPASRIEIYSIWPFKDQYDKNPELYSDAPLSLYGNSNKARLFQVAYIYQTRGGFVWESVDARDFNVSVDYEELKFQQDFNKNNYWGNVLVNFDKLSLDKLRDKYADADLEELPAITITISVVTQYGHRSSWEFKSKVVF